MSSESSTTMRVMVGLTVAIAVWLAYDVGRWLLLSNEDALNRSAAALDKAVPDPRFASTPADNASLGPRVLPAGVRAPAPPPSQAAAFAHPKPPPVDRILPSELRVMQKGEAERLREEMRTAKADPQISREDAEQMVRDGRVAW